MTQAANEVPPIQCLRYVQSTFKAPLLASKWENVVFSAGLTAQGKSKCEAGKLRRNLEMEMWNNANQIYILTVAAPLAFQSVQTKLGDSVMKKKKYKKKGISFLSC